ncbi:hypothetical protein HN51_043824, partial [Arachis hypogaea]
CLHWYTLLWHIFWGALKHVNGIEGRSTMVVRVIACFQPLHNCQIMRDEPFTVCSLYAFHMCKPCYEDDRKDGTRTTSCHSL